MPVIEIMVEPSYPDTSKTRNLPRGVEIFAIMVAIREIINLSKFFRFACFNASSVASKAIFPQEMLFSY